MKRGDVIEYRKFNKKGAAGAMSLGNMFPLNLLETEIAIIIASGCYWF